MISLHIGRMSEFPSNPVFGRGRCKSMANILKHRYLEQMEPKMNFQSGDFTIYTVLSFEASFF